MLAPITMQDENSQNFGTSAQQVRILIVDDHEPLSSLRFLDTPGSSKCPDHRRGGRRVARRPASKGLAISQPDVIILDIELPRLDGIEAARRIRQVAAESRIIFLNQETSADVREEAWALGAWGYVVKTQAGHELIDAVQAVSQGRKFVGDGFDGRNNPTSKEEPGK